MSKILGIVFPGQGSQSVGMLSDLALRFSDIEKTYRDASDVLGYDLWELVRLGPEDKLNQTMHTQPALLAGGYAVWRILQVPQPAVLAGHSLGEYTALVCAGALSFQDAVRLVAARGLYMQEAVPEGVGAMAAIIGLEDDKVKKICEQAALDHEVLSPANFNSPGQVVIAGHETAVARAMTLMKEAGARMVKQLPVSVPSHCELMKPAAARLEKILETIAIEVPRIPVLNNVDADFYQSATSIRDGLVRQLYKPIRWVDLVRRLTADGVTEILECGPGKVLTGLNKRIVTDTKLLSTEDKECDYVRSQ